MRTLIFLFVIATALPADARPSRWCGWFARTMAAVDPGPAYNVACKWLDYGQPTSAHVGAFAVWCSKHHRHVGKIVGVDANGNFVVTSGNDSGAVRSRVRSLAGAQFRE